MKTIKLGANPHLSFARGGRVLKGIITALNAAYSAGEWVELRGEDFPRALLPPPDAAAFLRRFVFEHDCRAFDSGLYFRVPMSARMG